MTEDNCKSLLFKFYGFDSDSKKVKKFSTSEGIEKFETVTDADEATEQLMTTEEAGKAQNDANNLDGLSDENNDTALSKSPHVLTIDDLEAWNKEDLQEPNSELDTSSDVNDKCVNKNVTRLEDTLTKAVAKVTDLAMRSDFNVVENGSTASSASVSKAKKLWRQKTILSKENAVCPTNLLSKFDGVFLYLNYMGITDFPTDILHNLKNLQMLYLDSNNLREMPKDLFVILKKLKWLDVRNNQLTTLPPTIKGHESLETLLLQGNNMEKLPLELGFLPSLKRLQTARNPLVFPPQQVLELDCLSIVNFLRKEWNKLHEDEQIELEAVSNDKVDKKPSTIICYQPLEKNLQKNFKYRNLSASKPSVRVRTWKYKPNSRYGLRNCSWALKKIENETILDNSIILCNFCAATLYRKGVFVSDVTNDSPDDVEKNTLNTCKKNLFENDHYVRKSLDTQESFSNLNFLSLTGPSPRSLFIRQNCNFLVNHKQPRVKLCQIKSINFNARDLEIKDTVIEKKLSNVIPTSKVFDVITNNRIRMKIKPLQLNESQVIMNFLKAILKYPINKPGLNKRKYSTCTK